MHTRYAINNSLMKYFLYRFYELCNSSMIWELFSTLITNFLRDHVVINPAVDVDVMARVVNVKDSPIIVSIPIQRLRYLE